MVCVHPSLFYVVEFAGFIPYNFAFVVLFLLHDRREWGKPEPGYMRFEYELLTLSGDKILIVRELP
jgi:hypothetical protein